MRYRTLPFLFAIASATLAQAAGIRYDRIAADATGYAHVDIDQGLLSQLAKQMGSPPAVLKKYSDLTFYARKSGEQDSLVLLIHSTDPSLRRQLKALVAQSPDATAKHGADTAGENLTVNYGPDEIYFINIGIRDLNLLGDSPAKRHKSENHATTRPAKSASSQGRSFSIGFGNAASQAFEGGPIYASCTLDDIIIFASDLPSITTALDVLHGKKRSIDASDPDHLKLDVPPGTIILGAGMTSTFRDDTHNDSASSPASELNVFSKFNGETRLASFVLGEDSQQFFMDGSVAMKSKDSAEKLGNLVTGLKTLISLTKANAIPLVNPIAVTQQENIVRVHWSWPVSKLDELMEACKQLNEESTPGSQPTTLPAH